MIGRHGDEFDWRNTFLQLALGFVSASHRLDCLLASYGRRAPEAPVGALTRQESLLVDFVLGLIAFQGKALGTLKSARSVRREVRSSPEQASLDGALR